MTCPICSSSMSEPVVELFALPSVASDCRPWSSGRSVRICSGCGVMKRVTNSDFNHDVYKEYTSYPEPTGRTAKILDFVKDKMPKPESVLDVGCSIGDGLEILQRQFPLSKVMGFEPRYHGLFHYWVKECPIQRFDLVTVFHVLEHVAELDAFLADIKSILAPNGHVLIQVPYALMWPFDLVIADHEWHFNKACLDALMRKSGFEIVYIGNDVIAKEITVLAYPTMLEYGIEFEDSKDPIDWLLSFKSKLDKTDTDVAIYGTSVSAMWAAMILGDKVDCYVDDDVNRLGTFNGKKVHSPYSVTVPIVAPFADWQLAEIKAKHPQLVFL